MVALRRVGAALLLCSVVLIALHGIGLCPAWLMPQVGASKPTPTVDNTGLPMRSSFQPLQPGPVDEQQQKKEAAADHEQLTVLSTSPSLRHSMDARKQMWELKKLESAQAGLKNPWGPDYETLGNPCFIFIEKLRFKSSQLQPDQALPVPPEQWNNDYYESHLPACLADREAPAFSPSRPGRPADVMPTEKELTDYFSRERAQRPYTYSYRNSSYKLGPIKQGEYITSLTRLLRIWSELMAKWDLPYWLEAGTLIAAERTGELLPWDMDVDIAMTYNTYRAIKWRLKHNKEDIPEEVDLVFGIKGWYKNYVDARLFDRATGTWLDLFPYKKLGAWYIRTHWVKRYMMPMHLVDPVQPCRLAGVDVKCPFDSMNYLLKYFKKLKPDMKWSKGDAKFIKSGTWRARGDPCRVTTEYMGVAASKTAHDMVRKVSPKRWSNKRYKKLMLPCLKDRPARDVVEPDEDATPAKKMPSTSEMTAYLASEVVQETEYAFQNRTYSRSKLTRAKTLAALRKLLRVWSKAMRKWKLPYWLEAGTLIGAMRTGKVLPWDVSVEVAMTANTFNALKYHQEGEGYSLPKSVELVIPVAAEHRNPVEGRLIHKATGVWLNLFKYKQIGPWYIRFWRTKRIMMPVHLVDPVRKCKMEGHVHRCPWDSAAYLRLYYRSSTPNRRWHRATQQFLTRKQIDHYNKHGAIFLAKKKKTSRTAKKKKKKS